MSIEFHMKDKKAAERVGDLWLIRIKILDLQADTVVGRVSARQVEGLGSNPSETQIFYSFRCVLFSLLPWRCVGRSNFDMGLHNFMLIKKNDIKNKINYVDSKYNMKILSM